MSVSTLYDENAQKVSIGKVSDLDEHVKRLLGAFRFDSIYLRGHRDETWRVLPTIGRAYRCDGREITKFQSDQEKYLLHRFRRSAYSFVGRVPAGQQADWMIPKLQRPSKNIRQVVKTISRNLSFVSAVEGK